MAEGDGGLHVHLSCDRLERVPPDGSLFTVEGNTNNDGSRSGIGVFRLVRRKVSDMTMMGFVDYSAS